MSKLYYEVKKEVDEITESCNITNSSEIRKMIDERIQAKMKEHTSELVDALNGGDKEVILKGMLEGINTSHRYLQGEFWGMMLKLIKKYGESEHFDARNEWAVDMCKRMAIAGENYGNS